MFILLLFQFSIDSCGFLITTSYNNKTNLRKWRGWQRTIFNEFYKTYNALLPSAEWVVRKKWASFAWINFNHERSTDRDGKINVWKQLKMLIDEIIKDAILWINGLQSWLHKAAENIENCVALWCDVILLKPTNHGR